MLDVMNAFKDLLDSDFRSQVTAVLSEVYMLNGHLNGEVYGDKANRFKNGTRIMTGAVNFGIEANGYQVYLTHSGSVYLVSSWRKFDKTWKAMDFSNGIQPIDFLFGTAPDRGNDFSEDQEVSSSFEAELVKVQIPNQRANRAIFLETTAVIDDDQATTELNSRIFELATFHLDTDTLKRQLEIAQDQIELNTKSMILIEYTTRLPDPFLLPLIALGFLPCWQALLVLDGQFNVSKTATNYLANALLVALPIGVLADRVLDKRMSLDLGL